MNQRRFALILIIVLLLSAASPLVVHAIRTAPAQPEQPTRSLSSLDGGVAGFLERHGSALAKVEIDGKPAAQIIENVSAYYNIESRIMLAVLETAGGLISAPTLPATATERPLGAGPAGFLPQMDWLAREIRVGFGPYDSDLTLAFSDGATRTVRRSEDAHAITVKRFFAFERTLAEWEDLITRYPTVYEALFRDEPAVSAPTPPASSGFLSEPWVPGTSVIHSSYFDHTYPMVDGGGDGNDVMTDYRGRGGLSYNSHDGHDYYFPDKPYGTPIVAAAPGWAFARTTRGLGVLIQHTGAAAGYDSVYWHLEAFAPAFKDAIDSSEPLWVERGALLGWSGATGFTNGAPHLHFEIRHNGNQVDPYGWYGPGGDPCVEYAKCEASTWLWNDSVPWTAPDAPARADTTPPTALLTINPPADLRLLAQFDGNALSAVGPTANSEGLSWNEGKWGQAARVGSGDSLTYPASPTLNLERGALALWVSVPEEWPESRTGRHYLAAASANPADPAHVYSGTMALRHEQRDGAPVWNFWTVPLSAGLPHNLELPDTLKPGWHHFVISWDRAEASKALFVDGVLAAQADGVNLPADVGESLELGRWTIGAGESGALFDEVASYDHPLEPAAVAAMAAATAAQQPSAARAETRDLTILAPAIDNGGGVVKAQLALNGVYAAPMPYYRAYRWMLPSSEGAYTVTIRLTDRVGNTTTLSRTISVDHLPQGNVRLREATPFSATLVISATDANLPLEQAISQIANPAYKHWEPLVAERIWQWLPMQPRRLYVWFRDANGNERGPYVVGPDLWRAYLPRIDR